MKLLFLVMLAPLPACCRSSAALGMPGWRGGSSRAACAGLLSSSSSGAQLDSREVSGVSERRSRLSHRDVSHGSENSV